LRVLKRLCAVRKVRSFSYSGLWERACACHWSSIWNVSFHWTQTEVSVPKIIEDYYSITSDKVLRMLFKTSKVTSLSKLRWLLVAMECVKVHCELETVFFLIFVTKLKRGSDVNVDKRVRFKLNVRCGLGHGSHYSRKITINSSILNFKRQSSETNRSWRHKLIQCFPNKFLPTIFKDSARNCGINMCFVM